MLFDTHNANLIPKIVGGSNVVMEELDLFPEVRLKYVIVYRFSGIFRAKHHDETDLYPQASPKLIEKRVQE